MLPSGSGSQSLRGVGERIAAMLEKIGIGTEITKVPDESYFKDHIASGDYDLALYSWPATAYPATDGRPIYAKPEPATDGSLLVEQNYTRVGTDHIDQLFDQAVAELDEKAARELMKQADARIWAAAGSIPLFQRPQLVAVDKKLANVGAFGFAAPDTRTSGSRTGERQVPPQTARSSRSPELPAGHRKNQQVSGENSRSTLCASSDAAQNPCPSVTPAGKVVFALTRAVRPPHTLPQAAAPQPPPLLDTG